MLVVIGSLVVFFVIVLLRVHDCCTCYSSCPWSCSVFVSLFLFMLVCVFLLLFFVRVTVLVIVRCSCSCDLFAVLVRVLVLCIVPVMCSRSCYRSYPLLSVMSIAVVLIIGLALGRVLCSCSFFVFCVRALVLCSAPLSVVLGSVSCYSSWS